VLALLGDRARSLTETQKGVLLKIAAEVMRGLDHAAAIRDAQRAEMRFRAQVAHDFNNVIMSIEPLTDAIRRRAGDDPALLRFTDLIKSSLQRGKRLTADLLGSGRPAPLAPASENVETARLLRALIVEDDEAVGTGLRLFLEAEGIDVRLVMSGAEVMPAIADRRPDIIVLDLSLPDEDGRRTYERIASEYSIPVIFSSGHATEGDVDDLMNQPRTAFLVKPYQIEDLLEAIRNLTGPPPIPPSRTQP
jgi:CheY-like chemotaxis protein